VFASVGSSLLDAFASTGLPFTLRLLALVRVLGLAPENCVVSPTQQRVGHRRRECCKNPRGARPSPRSCLIGGAPPPGLLGFFLPPLVAQIFSSVVCTVSNGLCPHSVWSPHFPTLCIDPPLYFTTVPNWVIKGINYPWPIPIPTQSTRRM